MADARHQGLVPAVARGSDDDLASRNPAELSGRVDNTLKGDAPENLNGRLVTTSQDSMTFAYNLHQPDCEIIPSETREPAKKISTDISKAGKIRGPERWLNKMPVQL